MDGPLKVLAVRPTIIAVGTPDDHPPASKLLFLDMPSDAQGPDARHRVSVLRCKPCRSPYDTAGIPPHLPVDVSTN